MAMASYNFVIAAVIALSISSCRADLISDVCAQTKSNSLCIAALRSDPRSQQLPEPTYIVLAEIAVGRAIILSKSVADVARNEPSIEGCAAYVQGARAKLEEAKGLLKEVKDAASRGYVDVSLSEAWEDSFACNGMIPKKLRPSTLKLYNDTFRQLVSIVRVIVLKIPLVGF